MINKSSFLKKKIIKIDNDLINCAQRLSLSEKRIIMLSISKLIDNENSRKVKIEALEYSELYNITTKTAYEQIKNACKILSRKYISIKKEESDEIEINWVSSAIYSQKKGFVEIIFTDEIQKYLKNLKNNFTSYNIEDVKNLKSIYSWRLLELLVQFKNTGWREITLKHFLETMDATEKQRKDFSIIRRKMIEPAVKELTIKKHWEIEWLTIKKNGKKVYSIFFKYKANIQ